MKIPIFNWIPFDKNNPPANLYDGDYLIFLREDNYDNLSPECLSKVLDITIDMIEEFDKNGLPND